MFEPPAPLRAHAACGDVVHRPIVGPCCDRPRHPLLAIRRLFDHFDRYPVVIDRWLPWEIDYADYLRQTNLQMPMIAPAPLPFRDPTFDPVPLRTPAQARPVGAPLQPPVERPTLTAASGAPKLGEVSKPTPPPPLRRIDRIIERHAPAATGKLIDLIA